MNSLIYSNNSNPFYYSNMNNYPNNNYSSNINMLNYRTINNGYTNQNSLKNYYYNNNDFRSINNNGSNQSLNSSYIYPNRNMQNNMNINNNPSNNGGNNISEINRIMRNNFFDKNIPLNNQIFQNNMINFNNQLNSQTIIPGKSRILQSNMSNEYNRSILVNNNNSNVNNYINNNLFNSFNRNTNFQENNQMFQRIQNNNMNNNNNINNSQINNLNFPTTINNNIPRNLNSSYFMNQRNQNSYNFVNNMTNYGINNNNMNNNFNNNNQFNNNNNQFNNNNNNLNNNNNPLNNNNNNNFNPKRIIKKLLKKENDDIELGFYVKAKGLENVGATCYMNATLQCFYHVKLLTENLINDEGIIKTMEITYCYRQLLKKLVGFKDKKRYRKEIMEEYRIDPKEKDHVKPEAFKDLISEKNPLFKGIKANDSKDLIIFLLENMDDELTKRNNRGVKETFYGKSLQQLEEENFKKTHNSIFADLFYGFQISIMRCEKCKYEDKTFSIFNFMIFPLEKIYNSLNKKKTNSNISYSNQYSSFQSGISNNYLNFSTSIGTINNEKRKLKLLDCFNENKEEEILTGSNQIYCNKCHNYSDALTKNDIFVAPNVLILIINRGRGNYFKCDLDFPKQLNISNYVAHPNSPKIYNLIGVISHLGESSMDGHFIAYCKHFDDNWYLFNDATATPVNDDGMYKGIPYILFYQNSELS